MHVERFLLPDFLPCFSCIISKLESLLLFFINSFLDKLPLDFPLLLLPLLIFLSFLLKFVQLLFPFHTLLLLLSFLFFESLLLLLLDLLDLVQGLFLLLLFLLTHGGVFLVMGKRAYVSQLVDQAQFFKK